MTIKKVLTKLGYKEAGVQYNEGVVDKIELYLGTNKINLSGSSYVEGDYKVIGTLYKYFSIVEDGVFKVGDLDFDDDSHYANLFWKI